MAQKLAEQWGKPVVVENQAGGSGSIGAAAVARAPADGYTLLVTVDIPLTMYPAVASRFRTTRAPTFAPSRPWRAATTACSSIPRSAFRRPRSWSSLRRSNRESSASHPRASPRRRILRRAFKAIAGVDMIHVPYKGAAPAMSAAMAAK
jgi:tripartite-type tricarboxylate transporter receptor subunit TctC